MADWRMGALAASDQYDPETGQATADLWQAEQPYRGVSIDPGIRRAPGDTAMRPAAAKMASILAAIPQGVAHTIATPGAQMARNPYPEGSEEAQWFENKRAQTAENWGPEMALNMVGAPGGVGGYGSGVRLPPSREPFLRPAVRVNDKIYKGDDHLSALSGVPAEYKAAAQLDGSNRGWVNDRGRFLNREKAQQYALYNDLIKSDAPDWVRRSPEAISEWLKPVVLGSGSGARLPQTKLPMDNASRMGRAAEQGYTIDAYHGTGSPEYAAFDKSAVKDNIQYGGNFYFTPEAEFANKHTGPWSGDTPRIMPVKLKAENPFRMDQPVTAEQAANVLEAAGRTEQAKAMREGGPLKYWTGSTLFYHGLGQETSAAAKADAIRKAGYDAIIGDPQREIAGTPGRPHIMVYEPDQIRSRFAAFDPANEGKGMLLGSGSGDKRVTALAQAVNRIANEGEARGRAPRQRPFDPLMDQGHVPQGTHASWLTRVDPETGATTLVNQSGPTGNAFTTLKNTTPPERMAVDIKGAPEFTRPELDMAALQRQKAELVFGPTDRTRGGGFLFGAGGRQFERPVLMEGGRHFPAMHENVQIPGMPSDVAPLYASVSEGASSKVNKVAQDVLERGGTPYYVPLIMTHGAGDSAKQMATTVHRAMQSANISKSAAEAFDKAVRAKNPTATATYPGFNSPELGKWLDTIGLNGRRAFVEGADTAGVLKATGVDVGELRYANTDPRLRHTPSGSGGLVMGRMRPDVGSTEHPLHTNYASTFMGQRGEIGGLPGNAPFSLLAPDVHRALAPWRSPGGGSLATTPATVAMRGIPGNVPKTQRVTDEVVNNIGEWFRRHPEGWSVPGAAGLGALAASDRYEGVY